MAMHPFTFKFLFQPRIQMRVAAITCLLRGNISEIMAVPGGAALSLSALRECRNRACLRLSALGCSRPVSAVKSGNSAAPLSSSGSLGVWEGPANGDELQSNQGASRRCQRLPFIGNDVRWGPVGGLRIDIGYDCDWTVDGIDIHIVSIDFDERQLSLQVFRCCFD